MRKKNYLYFCSFNTLRELRNKSEQKTIDMYHYVINKNQQYQNYINK